MEGAFAGGPPPLPDDKDVDIAKPTGLQDTVPQDFQKIVVHGRQKSPERRKRAAFQPSDQHLPTARLKLFCYDKTTGKPLANVGVALKPLAGGAPAEPGARNTSVSNAFGNRSYSRKDGYVVAKVLAGYSYLVAAQATGFHDFGHMGEQLLLTPKDTEVVTGDVGLVPVRISVVLTLRELRPMHTPDSIQRDATGQVNPLYSLPRGGDARIGPAPQKVSFYSGEGIKMDFVATSIECVDVLVGWPGALGGTAEKATCTLGVYSTDNDGHCFFYGPKVTSVSSKRGNVRRPREWATIDVGRWEYARKYHLRSNQESPVFTIFESYAKHVDYPAHVARYPAMRAARNASPTRGSVSPSRGGRSKEQLLSSFLQSAAEVAAAASNGGSVADPNEPPPPGGDGSNSAIVAAGGSSRSVAGNSARPVSGAASRAASRNTRSASGAASAAAAGAAGADGDGGGGAGEHEDLEAELRAYPDNNIHNYLDPGEYKLQMKDPSKLLIFYTYSGDGEAAEINRAQDAVVPFRLAPSDDNFIHPRDGSLLRPTRFPVQLYCRARPWFNIAVYDVESLEEIGSRYGLFFTIERIVVTKPAPGSGWGHGAAPEPEPDTVGGASARRRNNSLTESNPELAAYLDKQKERGRLAHLWAKAEVAESQAAGLRLALPRTDSLQAEESGAYPYKVEQMEVASETLYSGLLGQIREKMWMTPGEKYRITVHMRSPFLEYNAVQVRVANWELEPFVFYALKKVVLLVGVRERYNQLPMPGTEVVVEVREPPQPPRPPVVKPEWCETATAYAHRILDQLIDYVAQTNREMRAVDHGPVKEQRGFTDKEGLVSFEVPPEAKVYIRALNTFDFESAGSSHERALSMEREQFVGFELERVTRTTAVVQDSNTGQGLAGFELRAYDITDLVPNMPRDGTRRSRTLLDPESLDAIDTSGVEPFAVETTGPDGALQAPFLRRAGRVIKVEVAASPRTHHLPALVMPRAGNALFVVTYDKHSVLFKAPPRPRVRISAHDSCTFEEVFGVRFRIMTRPIGPPPPWIVAAEAAAAAAAAAAEAAAAAAANAIPVPPSSRPASYAASQPGSRRASRTASVASEAAASKASSKVPSLGGSGSGRVSRESAADAEEGTASGSRAASRAASVAGSARGSRGWVADLEVGADSASKAASKPASKAASKAASVAGSARGHRGSAADAEVGSRSASPDLIQEDLIQEKEEQVPEEVAAVEPAADAADEPADKEAPAPVDKEEQEAAAEKVDPAAAEKAEPAEAAHEEAAEEVPETVPEEVPGEEPAPAKTFAEGEELAQSEVCEAEVEEVPVPKVPKLPLIKTKPPPPDAIATVDLDVEGEASGATPPRTPTPTSLTHEPSPLPPPIDTAAVAALQEQQRETLARIDELEAGWAALAGQYAAEQTEALAAERRHLELLVRQLKAALKRQQQQLALLLHADGGATLEHNIISDSGQPVSAAEAAAAQGARLLASEKQPVYWDGVERLAVDAEEPGRNLNASLLDQMDVTLLATARGSGSGGGGSAAAAAAAAAAVAAGQDVDGSPGAGYAAAAAVALAAPGYGGRSAAGSGKAPRPDAAAAAAALKMQRRVSAATSTMPAGPSQSLHARLRHIASGGLGDEGLFGGLYGTDFGGRLGRGLGLAERGEDEDEEDALKRRVAAEEALMALFDPSPEEQEPWGRVVWESVTGLEENEDLIIDGDSEIAVQIFPCWPYDTRSQMLKGRSVGATGPPEFRFFLPRDGAAFRFWLERDNALPEFWDEEGAPVLPFHSLARLQPLAPPHRLLSRPHAEMKLLRTPVQDAEAAAAAAAGGGGGAGGRGAGGGGGWRGGGGGDDADGGTNPDGTPRSARSWAPGLRFVPTTRGRHVITGTSPGNAADGGADGPFGGRHLHRTVSAVQYDPDALSSEDANDLAWQQLRLSDASYLPLERTRLLQFLTKWGSFPHIAGGHCKACAGAERPPDTNPLLLYSNPPTPRFSPGDTPRNGAGGAAATAAAGVTYTSAYGMTYKSRLMAQHELSAGWVFDGRPPPRSDAPPHMRRHVPDRYSRTHTIMNASEAIYCRSPFFTWWLPNGGGVHVTMCDGLYRELIPLIDAVALSCEYMDTHLSKVRKLNDGRGGEGRFLLGHQVVDSCCGGVFIVDVSTAQPFSGVNFMLEQLAKTLDFWAASTPPGASPPRFNVLLCSREVIECWRTGLGHVTAGLAPKLVAWYEDVKHKMPPLPGFNMEKALRTAASMARSEVPLFLLCGGLCEAPLNGPAEMAKALYDMQLACINSQSPMQPIVCVELFPMPQARLDVHGSGGGAGAAGVPLEAPPSEAARHRRPSGAGGDADAASEVSLEDAAALGSNIFALLTDSLASGRVRLLEVFREVDKEGCRSLDWQALYRLVLRLVPDATPAHIRYCQLLLDSTGDNRVRYKDLAAAVRACGRGHIAVGLRDRLHVSLVLHKMAIVMLLGKTTPAELFARFDADADGFWNEREQWNMLKELFPGLRPAEHSLLFEAFKDVDKNQDGRISPEEFLRAFSSGGVPGLPGGGALTSPEALQRLREQGELDDFTLMALKSVEENARLARVRAGGFPLSETLVRVAGASRGLHRRLDLGRARAFADPIDTAPLESVRAALEANLQQLLDFERAYGRQLTADYGGRTVPVRSGSRGGGVVGTGSLSADPVPSPTSGAPRLAKPLISAGGASAAVAAPSAFGAARGRTGDGGGGGSVQREGSPTRSATSRPDSAGRRRPTSRQSSMAPSPRLLEPTASHSAYVAATSRPASALGSVGGAAAAVASPRTNSRPSSATRQRPSPAWAASAATSEDPHLRRLAAQGSRASLDAASPLPPPPAAEGSVSMPPIGRERSGSVGTPQQPWLTGSVGGAAAGLSREPSQRSSSLLASVPVPAVATGDDASADPRLSGRKEYQPPSRQRSLQQPLSRPASSRGSRNGPPSAEASGASLARSASSAQRPSSAPARRRSGASQTPGSQADGLSGISGGGAGAGVPPLAFGRLPSGGARRRELPMKQAMLGFEGPASEADDGASGFSGGGGGLPYLAPDAAAPTPVPPAAPAFHGSSRPSSAGRKSFGRRDSATSRGSGWS